MNAAHAAIKHWIEARAHNAVGDFLCRGVRSDLKRMRATFFEVDQVNGLHFQMVVHVARPFD